MTSSERVVNWPLKMPAPAVPLICDAAVRKVFTEAKWRYGAPRLARELPKYNVKTIAACLRRKELRAKASRKFSPVSYSEYGLLVSENLLKQDFSASGPNQKWAGDIMYLGTDEGWLYLAVVIDLWSRAVIGWSMSSRMQPRLSAMECKWHSGSENVRKMSSFTPTVAVGTALRVIRRY